MASVVYNKAKQLILKGDIDFDSPINVALVLSGYTPNIDTHDFFDDVTNEVSGTCYTAGGATLGSVTVTADNTDNEGVFDAADTSWSTATITARAAVIYKSTGTASTSALIAYVDFGADKVSTAGTFTIQWNSEGILNLN